MPNTIKQEILKRFQIDKNRDMLVPDREFLMADMSPAVKLAKKELAIHGLEFTNLASWQKAQVFPEKAKGFLVKVFQGLELGMIDELNIQYQLKVSKLRPLHKHHDKESGNSIEVKMMFMGGSTRNDNLKIIGEIAQEALGNGTKIVVMCGSSLIDGGKKFTNHNAQKEIERIIADCAGKNQKVLIIAANMAQRSFSIPGLGVVYLCYDRGQEGATRQKLSRVLTADTLDKVGRIVSCSFDPNRDDKIDTETFATADRIAEKKGMPWAEALKYVLSTGGNFYIFSENGAIPINPDEYMKNTIDQRRAHRQLGAMTDLNKFDDQTINDWANADTDYSKNAKTDTTEEGTVWDPDKPKPPKKSKSGELTKEQKDARSKARASIVTFYENFHYIKDSTNATSVKEMLDEIRKSKEDQEWFYEYFGIQISTLDRSLASGGINYKHLEITLSL
jgi:hypothetical protein